MKRYGKTITSSPARRNRIRLSRMRVESISLVSLILAVGTLSIRWARKLWGYLLNPKHEHGCSHAYLFKRLLDIDLSNWNRLRDELKSAAREGVTVPGGSSAYGQKYEIRFMMNGPRGDFTILSVWITPRGDTTPQFVTAYIE